MFICLFIFRRTMYKKGYLNKNINIWSYFSSKAKILKGTVHIFANVLHGIGDI